MNWFATADQHFGHINVMLKCKRPFSSVDEMDQALIDSWNLAVKPSDTVIFAGDMAMDYDYENLRYRYLRHLNGNLILVKGNHDFWMKQSKVEFRHIYHKQIKGGPFLAVSHYPMRSWNRSQYGALNLHGHCHGTIEPWKNQLDVGVDSAFKLVGSFRPLELSEIVSIINDNNEGAKGHDYHTDLDD